MVSPAMMALLLGSFLSFGALAFAAGPAAEIRRRWDLTSGSDRQLRMERRTYLISALVNWVMAYEIISLFLFIRTVDDLHPLFTGAMCAAGTLNVTPYGYPALVMKIVNAVLCGVWAILNAADNRAPDYPLIRIKYRWLLWMIVPLSLEAFFQWRYWTGLRPDIITSCCGTLFSDQAATVAGHLSHLPMVPTRVLFFLGLLLTLRMGVHFLTTGRAAALFAIASGGLFILSLIAVISFISVYYYELPTHHCPFCLLQSEYGHVGYLLYAALLTGVISGTAMGILDRFKARTSLGEIVPRMQRRLCLTAMIGYGIFGLLAAYPMIFTDFRMGT